MLPSSTDCVVTSAANRWMYQHFSECCVRAGEHMLGGPHAAGGTRTGIYCHPFKKTDTNHICMNERDMQFKFHTKNMERDFTYFFI